MDELNINNIDIGFILPFHFNDHLPKTPIIELIVDQSTEMTAEIVYEDISAFIRKYFMDKYTVNINLSFLSDYSQNCLLNRYQECNTQSLTDLICIFDKAMIEMSEIMQFTNSRLLALLSREYILVS